MNQAPNELQSHSLESSPTAKPVQPTRQHHVAFIHSLWHHDIVESCRTAFLQEISTLGIPETQINFFPVPGAYEIPLHAQLLAKTGRYTAIVAAGLVVDGGIYRHEFVANTVINALMQIQLQTEVPIFSAVLTPQQFHEHATHADFFTKHFVVKGIEVAKACFNTLSSIDKIDGRAGNTSN